MTTAMTKFHEEHDGLAERAELLAEVARELPSLSARERKDRVRPTVSFLQSHRSQGPPGWTMASVAILTTAMGAAGIEPATSRV